MAPIETEDQETAYEAVIRQVDIDAEPHNDRVKFHAERVKDAIKTFLDTKADWERLETITR